MHSPYPVPPEKWPTTPIVRGINPLTQLIEGDDSGYRKVSTLMANLAPLVNPAILCRPSYDGVREDGAKLPSIALPGGLRDGILVVRETFARDLEDANQLLQKVFGGEYTPCALDGFRSWHRQAAGFTRMLHGHMQRLCVTAENADDRIANFINAGNAADGTFAWVNADTTSPVYVTLLDELRKDAKLMTQLRDFAATLNGGATPDNLIGTLYTYVTISANSGIGRAANRGIPLVFENNAHAGGGACDVFLLGRNGLPLNHIPFDYPGEEAGMDYLEQDAHFEAYVAKASSDPLLQEHLLTLGLSPDTVTRNHWEQWRSAVRVIYHMTRAKGWTFYSSEHGGENWHLEGNNKCYSVESGMVFRREVGTAQAYPDSGNPGHALQLHGRDAVAVWGGKSGHTAARSHGLEV